ncbi:MAG: hypothetical protein BKP49_10280 [Treponema sp. CETP13]|nr:MAG: hypothetical protein BKP49_10280 [Treponema sp. CETP13]
MKLQISTNSKKRLAFSCAGEGYGHIARIVALSEELKNDFDLFYFVPESVQDFLINHLGNVTVISIPSFHFVLKQHGVDYLQTGKENCEYIIKFKSITKSIQEHLKIHEIDALVCDFEPFVSSAAAALNIPFMNFSHPGILLKTFPLSFTGICSRIVARFMTPSSQANKFCSFYNGEIGPVIRKEIRNKTPIVKDFYLVYTKKDSRNKILKTLENFPHEKFEIYPRKDGDFAEALRSCKGVIAPAGHQLLSEALYLNKPILAIPQKNQYEQKVNARMLEKSGRGFAGNIKSIQEDLFRFIHSINEFPYKENKFEHFCFTDDTQTIVNFIIRFVYKETQNNQERKNIYTYTYFNTIQEKIQRFQNEILDDSNIAQ